MHIIPGARQSLPILDSEQDMHGNGTAQQT